MNLEKYSVLVVGAGRIAGGFENYSDTEIKLTHAWAYREHKKFQINACIEPDIDKRKAFMKKWSIKNGFSDIASYKSSGLSCDIISISTPTNSHSEIIKQFLDTPVKAFFCEKPITDSIEDTKFIVNKINEKNIPFAVGYLRRWNKSINEIKNELDNEEWGKIRSVVGIYSKGVLNNGSHLIDTIGYLLGDLRINVVTAKRIDYMPDDPTVDAAMYLKDSTPVNLIGTDSRDFTIFELHIYLEEGVISIEQSGLVIRRRKRLSDNIYLGYKKLQLESQEDLAQENPYIPVLDNLVDSIENQGILKSGIMNAFHTQLLCDDLINLSKSI